MTENVEFTPEQQAKIDEIVKQRVARERERFEKESGTEDLKAQLESKEKEISEVKKTHSLEWELAKRGLVFGGVAAFQQGKIRIAKGIADRDALVNELKNYKRTTNISTGISRSNRGGRASTTISCLRLALLCGDGRLRDVALRSCGSSARGIIYLFRAEARGWLEVCSICSSLVLEWRSLVRAVIFSILVTAPHDSRAGFLGMIPARVFVLRGARMASKGFRPRP